MKLTNIFSSFRQTFTPGRENQKPPEPVVLTRYRKLPPTPLPIQSPPPVHTHKPSIDLKSNIGAALEEMQKRRYGTEAISAARRWGIPDDVASVSNILLALNYKLPNSIDDIYLHRSCDPEFLNMEDSSIENNGKAVARIRNTENLKYNHNTSLITSTPMKAKDLPHGGINFIVSTDAKIENGYHGESCVAICCSLRDVFELGGKIHGDIGAAVSNAVLVEMPQNTGLPFKLIS